MDNEPALHTFERYLQRRYPERSTAKHYLSDLRQFQKVCTKPWREVTPQDIEAFVDHGQQLGWKPSTLTRRVAALKTFFEFWAVETNALDCANPVHPERHAPKRGQRLPRDVPDDVLERLWLALDQPRDQVWFTLMLRGGLRVSEVVALNRRDVLSPAADGQPARVRVLGKGRKERIIYLSADAYAVVARWLMFKPGTPEMPLCPNARGKRLTVNGLQERLHHACQQAGVQVTCHQLRHTYARHLVEHDLPVTTLSRLLGHECLSTTQVYLTGADPQVREAYTTAMTHWEQATPLATTASATPPSPGLAERPAAPTSQSPTPTVELVPSPLTPQVPPRAAVPWAADLPEWVRMPCLAWVEQQARHWKPSYGQRHRQHRLRVLAQFWHWQLARHSLQAWAELTRADVQDFVDDCVNRKRSASTVKNVLYPLWGVLRLRQAQGETIPESLFRLDLPKADERTPRHLSEAEAIQLERHLRAYLVHDTPEARRDAAWYFVLAHTGIRLGELIDLRQGDLDLAGGRLRIDEGKGHKDRIVYLSAMAQQAVEHYLARLPAQPPEAPLFYRATQAPLAYRWVQFRLRQLGEEAGVAHLSPHRLRHTLATRLINQGVAVTTIQKILGHVDLNTTQRYARVADPIVEQDYQQAMAKIEQQAQALHLAPIPLDALLAAALADVPRPYVTESLDNSM